MNPIRSALVLAVVLCSLGLLPAQTPQGSPSAVPTENMLKWPNGLGSGVLRKVIGLFWNSVDHPSAVGLRGTATGLAIDPGITSYIEAFSGESVVDCVRLPHAGLLGAPSDGLLMSVLGGAELRFGYVDPSGVPQFEHLGFPGWWRASLMATLADATGIDVVARSMTGNTVLRLRYDYQLRAFAELAPLPLPEAVRDLDVIDFDGDGLGDVAVLTDSQLRIYDVNGGPMFTLPLAHHGGAIAPVPEPGQRGALALLQRRDDDEGWQLRHITDGLVESAVDISINGADFALGNLTSGDMDDDGDHDLAVQNGDTKVLIVRNTVAAGRPHFDGADTRVLTAGNQVGVQSAASMFDYDFDGKADLCVPLAANNGNTYLVVTTALQSLFQINVFSDIFSDSFHELPGGGVIELSLVNLDQLPYDQVTVTYYSATEETVTDGGYAEQVAVTTQPIDGNATDMTIATPMPVGHIDNPQLLFVKVQFSSPGNTKTKPTFLAGATIDNDLAWGQPLTTSSAYLAAHRLPGTTDKQIKRELQDPTNPNNQGRQQIGLIGAQKSLPYF